MHLKGFLKRFAPFFITFALGLFVASFFVTVALPNIRFNRQRVNRHQRYHRQMESENQRLREENLRLKQVVRDISETKEISETGPMGFDGTINDLVPPPPPLAPPAPPAVRFQR
jgi:hypothetical protein